MKMFFKYLGYVLRHKWFVLVECIKMGIVWRGLVHDNSKFLPSEFFPYMKFFYGTKTEAAKDAFDKAWLLHQKRNPHHYQYWILNKDDGGLKFIPMESKYLIEMVCDWKGAGKAITGKNDLENWFTKNKAKLEDRMHPHTFYEVERLVQVIS